MRNNGLILVFLTVISSVLFIVRLYYLQIIDDTYRDNPLHNAAITAKYDYPKRGYIYDRNNKLLVANQASYDVMVVPNEVNELDTLEFCNILSIDKDFFLKQFKKAKRYSPRLASIFLEQLSKSDYAVLQEKMFRFKGFYIQKRLLRDYPYNSSANVLGYISQVSEIKAKNNPYYQQGELIGTSGVEKQYEKILRGVKGVKYFKRNIHNKIIGSYKDGKHDTLAEVGKDLQLTIDIDLQQYGEWLLENKRGGVVAIEPSSGEILALITAPSYNPNLMVGRDRSKNFNKLYLDKVNKPLFDRSLQAQYSPGSTFKMVNALVALKEGVITPQSSTRCYGGYKYGHRSGDFMGCHCHTNGRPLKLSEAIYKSCNSYFSNSYTKTIEKYPSTAEGMNHWSENVKKFGLGNYLGYDLPVGKKGLIPNADYYNRYYPKNRWRVSYTISNAIGQGEILTTPIQLANMTCAVANRGYYKTPHIVKKIDNKLIDNPKFTKANSTEIDPEYFELVVNGMQKVFEQKGGTAYYSQVQGLELCGKTGTVENFIKINGEKIAMADHSIFIAFAPKNDPKIAIAVFIENGGFGSTVAAPIASLMIEKYLNNKIKIKWRETNVHDINLYEREYDKMLDLKQQKDVGIK
jgi:penicillin-binding protein 2